MVKSQMICSLKKKYSLLFLLLLLSLIFFHGAINYFWIGNNNVYYHTDEYYHLTLSINIYRILFSNETNFDFVKNPMFYQRPLIPFITAMFLYPIFGVDANVAIMTNMLFLGILVFSVYGIGKRIYSRNTGLLAAFLITMYPMLFGLSRFYTYFVGLTAMVSLSIYLLLLSNKFENRKYSLLFGLCCVVGMLTNITFIIFLVCPVLYVIISSLKCVKKVKRLEIVSNFTIFLLIFFLVAGILYVYFISKYGFFTNVVPRISKTIFFPVFKHIYRSVQYSLYSFVYYLEKLVNYQIFLPFSILFFVGLFFYIKSKNKNTILFLWLIFPYLVFSFMFIKYPTYAVPILPVVAIFSVFWIYKIKNKTLQKCIVLSIIVWGFVQFFIVSYTTLLTNLSFPGFKIESYTNPSSKLDWKEGEILMYIINNSERYPTKVVFSLPPMKELRGMYGMNQTEPLTTLTRSTTFFNPLIFTYYSLLHRLPVEIYLISNSSEVYSVIQETDFLIVKSNYQTIQDVNATVTIFNSNNFYPVKNFLLPDNSEITILKKYE